MALSFLQLATDGTNLTTYTFASQNLGTAASDRYIVVAITGRQSGGGSSSVSSVTIGGVSATISVQSDNNGDQVAIAIAAVPTGTTGNIDIVWSAAMTDCSVAAYRVTRVTTTTATSTGSSTATPPSANVNVVAGGVVIAVSKNRTGGTSATWGNVTEDFDTLDATGNDISGGSFLYSTTQTGLAVSCTWASSSLPKMVVASFQLANDYIQGLSETATATDVVSKSTGKALSDIFSASDTIQANRLLTAGPFTESVTLTDSFSRAFQSIRSLSETLTASDSYSNQITILRTFTENIVLVDTKSSASAFIRSLTDTTSISDISLRLSGIWIPRVKPTTIWT